MNTVLVAFNMSRGVQARCMHPSNQCPASYLHDLATSCKLVNTGIWSRVAMTYSASNHIYTFIDYRYVCTSAKDCHTLLLCTSESPDRTQSRSLWPVHNLAIKVAIKNHCLLTGQEWHKHRGDNSSNMAELLLQNSPIWTAKQRILHMLCPCKVFDSLQEQTTYIQLGSNRSLLEPNATGKTGHTDRLLIRQQISRVAGGCRCVGDKNGCLTLRVNTTNWVIARPGTRKLPAHAHQITRTATAAMQV